MDDVALFYSLLRAPRNLSEEEKDTLRKWAQESPYFQGKQLLIAAYSNLLWDDLPTQTRHSHWAVTLLPDTFALFRYKDLFRLQESRKIQSETRAVPQAPLIPKQTAPLSNLSTTTQSDLEGVLEHSLQVAVPFPAPTFYTLENSLPLNIEELYEYVATQLNPRYTAPAPSDTYAAQEPWKPIPPEEQMDRINFFLQNLDAEDGIKETAKRDAERQQELGIEPENLAHKSGTITHSATMERIASLHEQREEYANAIRVYEKLVQAFPKKSSYFAKEIERLRELLESPNE